MKFVRTIAAVLILAMASGPALAAVCAISCAAADEMMNSVASVHQNASAMTGDHCHRSATDSNKQEPDKHQQSDSENKSCIMAAGCHSPVAVPLVSPLQLPIVDFTSTIHPCFNPSVVCADLPPPLKPPA